MSMQGAGPQLVLIPFCPVSAARHRAIPSYNGYEGWQTISLSHNGEMLAVILGNPAMIDAYKAGVPGNGKPFPDGAKMAKIHWNAKKNETAPGQRRLGIWRV